VYVDDAPRNVEVACELGFDAILFEGVEALRTELVARQLLSA
jgi:hypothetical protein